MLRVYSFKIFLIFAIFLELSSSRINVVPMAKLATCREFVTDAKECEHYFPIDFMKNYHSDKYNLYLKLYSLAYHDANIVLSNSKSTANCRIVIGGWSNTLSVLNCNGQDLDKSHIKNITSPMWPISIIIRQTTCGFLDVSVPGFAEPLLTANVTNLSLNYICLYSYGKTNRWFYNCTEEEDNLYQFKTNNCTLFSQYERINEKQNNGNRNGKCTNSNENDQQINSEIVNDCFNPGGGMLDLWITTYITIQLHRQRKFIKKTF